MDLMRLRERGARRFCALARLADAELAAHPVDEAELERVLLAALNQAGAVILDALGAVETTEGE